MNPAPFEGSRDIGKPADMTDEQCFSIPAFSGIDDAGFPFWLTKWMPSYEDLRALNNGEGFYIKSTSLQLIPMAVFTLDENGKCNDAD